MREYTEMKVKEVYDHFLGLINDKSDNRFISFKDALNLAWKCGYSQAVAKKIIERAEQKGVIKVFKDEIGQKHIEFLEREIK